MEVPFVSVSSAHSSPSSSPNAERKKSNSPRNSSPHGDSIRSGNLDITEKEIHSIEDTFFPVIDFPTALCSSKTGKVVSVNSAMERELGFSKDQLTEGGYCELKYLPLHTSVPTRASLRTVEFCLPDGTRRELLCNCTIDSEKELLYIVSLTNSLRDFTSFKETLKSRTTTTSLPAWNILVVDDNSVQQKLLSLFLKKLGFTPDVAHNGEEAVNAIEKKSYDIVFMDVCMPVMNGWQATKEIKRKRSLDAPFIIAATSNTHPDDKRRCLEAGMDSFIPKPVQFDEVKAVLNAATEYISRTESPNNSDSSFPAEAPASPPTLDLASTDN